MKPRNWILIIGISLLIALIIVGYFGFELVRKNTLPGKLLVPSRLNSFHVDIRDYGFIPENLTIDRGEEVVWKNLATQNHSVSFPYLNLSSGVLVGNGNYSVVFNFSGNFTYECKFHPDKKGMIIVK